MRVVEVITVNVLSCGRPDFSFQTWCALVRLILDVILLAPRNLWWVLDYLRTLRLGMATPENGYLSRQVQLWHSSISATLLINGGCWPHIPSPLTLHFTSSYGGFCWSVSWSFFSACCHTRRVSARRSKYVSEGSSAQQTCVWPTHPDNCLFCIVIQRRQLERILEVVGVWRCGMVSPGLE
jgi:hypothetical protein